MSDIPFFNQFVAKLDENIGRYGLQTGMAEIGKAFNSRPIVSFPDEKTVQDLRGKPVILVVNHPYQAEFLPLLASLPPRKDVYLIASNEIFNISPNLDRHLIPVFIQHRKIKNKMVRILHKFLISFHHSSRPTPQEAHQKNIEGLKNAGQKIEKGAMVIIVPDGGSIDGKWRPGLGYLIKGVKRKDALFIMAYVQGTSYLDYLRLIPLFGRVLSTFKVFFSKPVRLNQLSPDSEAREIVLKAEDQYHSWIKSLSNTKIKKT